MDWSKGFYLHSNMSLFKCVYATITAKLYDYLHSNMSLFKFTMTEKITDSECIYIPICLYLNNIRYVKVKGRKRIYIPICLYLNAVPSKL